MVDTKRRKPRVWVKGRAFAFTYFLCSSSSDPSIQPWTVQPNLLCCLRRREDGVEKETSMLFDYAEDY